MNQNVNQNNVPEEQKPTENKTVIIIQNRKSIGLSLILTFLFGPLGMLYSTIIGAIVMAIISVIVFIFTLGVGLIITHPICIIWGVLAANNYNNKIIAEQHKN